MVFLNTYIRMDMHIRKTQWGMIYKYNIIHKFKYRKEHNF